MKKIHFERNFIEFRINNIEMLCFFHTVLSTS